MSRFLTILALDPARLPEFYRPIVSASAFVDECLHLSVQPTFDEEAASGLPALEIKRRWPRFMGKCPECRQHLILYASYMHYIYGDW